ncbi:MAG: hypothetical protein QW820_06515 [Sulfolobales archaeon]
MQEQELELADRARRLLRTRSGYVVEEPVYEGGLEPLVALLLLPFLPLILLYQVLFNFAKARRRIMITEIERTETGYRILEYEV